MNITQQRKWWRWYFLHRLLPSANVCRRRVAGRFCESPVSALGRSRQDARNGSVRIVVRQFYSQETFAAIQLLGQFDACVHRRIYKLHRLESIFSASGFKRRQRFILWMMLFVIPFPYGWQCEPAFLKRRLRVGAIFINTLAFIG